MPAREDYLVIVWDNKGGEPYPALFLSVWVPPGTYQGDGDIEEVAERIFRAVNSHDELVAALTALTKWAERINEYSNEGGLLGDEYEAALAALSRAQAEGR